MVDHWPPGFKNIARLSERERQLIYKVNVVTGEWGGYPLYKGENVSECEYLQNACNEDIPTGKG